MTPRSPAATWRWQRIWWRHDTRINRLHREIFRAPIAIGDDIDTREWAMHMLFVARALERIGDNAVDIGEQTAFVVTRPVPRVHRPLSSRPASPDAAPDTTPESL